MKKIFLNIREHIENFVKVFRHSKVARLFLYGILLVDLLFVFLHVYTFFLPAVEGELLMMRLDTDFGYAEMFQYFKFVSAALLLFLTAIERKKGVYLVWSIFFAVLFLDDSFSLHERMGNFFVKVLDLPAVMGLRAQDFGELLASGVLGLIFLFPIVYFQFFATKHSRFINSDYIILFGVLVFFGVGIDMLHSIVYELPGMGLLTIVEDGGEMLAVSFILWYSFYLYEERRSPEPIANRLKFAN